MVDYKDNCTSFPSLCLVGSTWDKELITRMGVALAKDCIEHDVDMLLGPGVNIKRHILCGRNFEYISEDPVLAGEMAAAYINGLQSLGVAASLKLYAANNQERYRTITSVDADIRTLMEIYQRAFEIAIEKSSPAGIMCAYNKIHSIWCSENKFLLTEVLRDTWGYEGFVVSDWGAVHNPPRTFKAGLDMQMPKNDNIENDIQNGIENGEITMEEIDVAVKRMIEFFYLEMYQKTSFSREMLWPKNDEFQNFVKDTDLIILFVGAMESEDTEHFNRRTAEFNPNYEKFIDYAVNTSKKVVVVMQSGSAMNLGDWKNNVHGIVQMWLGGEGAGGAIYEQDRREYDWLI